MPPQPPDQFLVLQKHRLRARLVLVGASDFEAARGAELPGGGTADPSAQISQTRPPSSQRAARRIRPGQTDPPAVPIPPTRRLWKQKSRRPTFGQLLGARWERRRHGGNAGDMGALRGPGVPRHVPSRHRLDPRRRQAQAKALPPPAGGAWFKVQAFIRPRRAGASSAGSTPVVFRALVPRPTRRGFCVRHAPLRSPRHSARPETPTRRRRGSGWSRARKKRHGPRPPRVCELRGACAIARPRA